MKTLEVLEKAIYYHKDGNLDEAINNYQKVIELDDKQPDANHNLALIFWGNNRRQKAIEYAERAISLSADIQHWKTCLKFFVADKNWVDALRILEGLTAIPESKIPTSEIIPLRIEIIDDLVNFSSDPELTEILLTSAKYGKDIAPEILKHPDILKRNILEKSVLSCGEQDLKAIKELIFNCSLPNSSYLKVFIEVVETNGCIQIEKIKMSEFTSSEMAQLCYQAGTFLLKDRKYKSALEHLKTAFDYDPANAFYAINFSNCLEKLVRHSEAIDVLSTHKNVSGSTNLTVEMNMGALLKLDRRPNDAITIFQDILSIEPDNIVARFNLASTYLDINNHDLAEKNFQKCLELDATHVNALHNLAIVKHYQSKKEPALALIDKALEMEHSNCRFWYAKALIDPLSASLSDLEHLEKMANSANRSDQIYLRFALAKFYRKEDTSKCFKFLKTANDLGRELVGYNPKREKVFFDNLTNNLGFCDAYQITEAHWKPIFIVGMPRSGTTLLEKAISSSREVTALGELPYLSDALVQNRFSFEEFDFQMLNAIRTHYFSRVSGHQFETSRFVDKMPLNFRWVPIIVACFPEARIVHVTRDKRATIWSNYWQYFPKHGNSFSFSLADISTYYDHCSNFMLECKNHYDSQLISITYEDLVDSPDVTLSSLANFLEIDIDAGILNQTNTSYRTNTASHGQIREPLYSGSNSAWKKFEKFLPEELFSH